MDWIAAALVLAGVFFYGQKSILGPIISMGACLLWAVIGAHAGMPAMTALNIILIVPNFYNLMIWSK